MLNDNTHIHMAMITLRFTQLLLSSGHISVVMDNTSKLMAYIWSVLTHKRTNDLSPSHERKPNHEDRLAKILFILFI